MAERARAFSRVVVDVGTGDGRYPLLVARASMDTFVIGIDPATDALAHAARRVARDRTPNVALIVGAVETVGCELAGIANEVRVHFPWGRLLRGVIGDDDAVLGALSDLPCVGGQVTAMLSITPSDGVTTDPLDPSRIASRWTARDFAVTKLRSLTKEDVEESASSWGKRLGVGRTRPGLFVRARRMDRTSPGPTA